MWILPRRNPDSTKTLTWDLGNFVSSIETRSAFGGKQNFFLTISKKDLQKRTVKILLLAEILKMGYAVLIARNE